MSLKSRFSARLLAGTLLMVAVFACSDSEVSTVTDAGDSGPDSSGLVDDQTFGHSHDEYTSNASDAQLDVLADDVVTPEEYRWSFDQYRDCVHSVGARITNVRTDPETGLILYFHGTTSEEQLTASDECYDEHFRLVDMIFQSRPVVNEQRFAENLVYWREEVHPCLERNGITGSPPDLGGEWIEYGTPEAEWFEQFFELLNAGAC